MPESASLHEVLDVVLPIAATHRLGVLVTGDAARAEIVWPMLRAVLPEHRGVGAADLLSVEDAAAMVCAANRPAALLARAPALGEVPAVLNEHLPLVIDLWHVPSVERLRALLEPGLSVERPRWSRSTRTMSDVDAIRVLEEHGIRSHRLDLASAHLARGGASQNHLMEVLVAPRLVPAQTPPEQQPSPGVPGQNDDPDTASDAPEPEPHSDGGADAEGSRTPEASGQGASQRSSTPDGCEPEDSDPTGTEQPAVTDPPPEGRRLPGRVRGAKHLPGRGGRLTDAPRGRSRAPLPTRHAHEPISPLDTLQAAAPWQPLRRTTDGAVREGFIVYPEDLRTRPRVGRGGRLTIIVVDASGSMGRTAMAAARATALGVLEQGYRRRDRVGIVLARGPRASVGLSPTRSMTRARACVRSLPTGGGTPLASAYLLAARMAGAIHPAQVHVLVLSDGRANVPLADGGDPSADAEQALTALHERAADVTHIPLGPARSRRPQTSHPRRRGRP